MNRNLLDQARSRARAARAHEMYGGADATLEERVRNAVAKARQALAAQAGGYQHDSYERDSYQRGGAHEFDVSDDLIAPHVNARQAEAELDDLEGGACGAYAEDDYYDDDDMEGGDVFMNKMNERLQARNQRRIQQGKAAYKLTSYTIDNPRGAKGSRHRVRSTTDISDMDLSSKNKDIDVARYRRALNRKRNYIAFYRLVGANGMPTGSPQIIEGVGKVNPKTGRRKAASFKGTPASAARKATARLFRARKGYTWRSNKKPQTYDIGSRQASLQVGTHVLVTVVSASRWYSLRNPRRSDDFGGSLPHVNAKSAQHHYYGTVEQTDPVTRTVHNLKTGASTQVTSNKKTVVVPVHEKLSPKTLQNALDVSHTKGLNIKAGKLGKRGGRAPSQPRPPALSRSHSPPEILDGDVM